MTFKHLNERREVLSFLRLFFGSNDRGRFKKPRISAHFVNFSHFGGLFAGEKVSVLRGFGCFLRGLLSFLRILTLLPSAPIFIFISLKNKKKYKKEGLINGFSACAVLYISDYLPTRFFLGCAVFSRSFRALEFLLIQWFRLKKGQMRGCAGYFACGCLGIVYSIGGKDGHF